MNQKSSLRKDSQFVSWALTGNTRSEPYTEVLNLWQERSVVAEG
jgi:hypothetical protein